MIRTTSLDLFSMLWSLLMVGIGTFLLWLIFGRQWESGGEGMNRNEGGRRQRSINSSHQENIAMTTPPTTTTTSRSNVTTSAEEMKTESLCTRTPCHISSKSALLAQGCGSNLLADGLVCFRHTKAASLLTDSKTNNNSKSILDTNRKDRAKFWSSLFLDSDQQQQQQAPPTIGAMILVSIPAHDVGCIHLARVLYLLASLYNLIVVIALEPEHSKKQQEKKSLNHKNSSQEFQTKQMEWCQKLRCNNLLTPEDLPNHRIILSTTTAGRVALARQLQRPELILEFDTMVQQTLTRFGHVVVLYNNNNTKSSAALDTSQPQPQNTISMLGQKIMG